MLLKYSTDHNSYLSLTCPSHTTSQDHQHTECIIPSAAPIHTFDGIGEVLPVAGRDVTVVVLVLPGVVDDGLHLDVRGAGGVRAVRGQHQHRVVGDGGRLAALERAVRRGGGRSDARGRH